jgi:hypothetical protein
LNFKSFHIFIALFSLNISFAQSETFKVELEDVFWPQAPGMHSFALGEWDGNWYIFGGRTNGLHGFLSPLAFPSDGRQEAIQVIYPEKQQNFQLSLDGLDTLLFEALTSSNMPFYQNGKNLIVVGGYGWSRSVNDFITFPTLSVIDLQCVAETDGPIAGCIQYIEDERMAICGAHLQMIEDTFYLVFGHRFDGIYNRNAANNFFTQTYSNEIRSFQLKLDGAAPEIINYKAVHDSINFHRRDYNLVPQIFPDRTKGFTAFSGVFQYNSTIPYLNSVDIKSNTQTVNEEFNQHLSQYHSAVMPVYDSTNNEMINVFFGGMSQFYLDTLTNLMVEDTLVPFVNTVSKITRKADGSLEEVQLDFSMAELEGTNAEFIPLKGVKTKMQKIIDLNDLNNRQQVGWIFGGIISPEINISQTDPSISYASNKLYKVFIDKTIENPQKVFDAVNHIKYLKLFPNPGDRNNRMLEFELLKDEQIQILLTDKYGRNVRELYTGKLPAGKHIQNLKLENLKAGSYLLRLQAENYRKVISFIII